MSYNYDKLSGKIREKFRTQEAFAKAMDRAPSTISQKLNNQRDWTRAEIERACALLDISLEDAAAYFFAF